MKIAFETRAGVLCERDIPEGITQVAGQSGIGKSYVLRSLFASCCDGSPTGCVRTVSPVPASVGLIDSSRLSFDLDMFIRLGLVTRVGRFDLIENEEWLGIVTSGGQLSLGQSFRLSLELVIKKQPSLVLIDEGFGSLDARTLDRVLSFIKENVQGGSRVIFTSHIGLDWNQHGLSAEYWALES